MHVVILWKWFQINIGTLYIYTLYEALIMIVSTQNLVSVALCKSSFIQIPLTDKQQ